MKTFLVVAINIIVGVAFLTNNKESLGIILIAIEIVFLLAPIIFVGILKVRRRE